MQDSRRGRRWQIPLALVGALALAASLQAGTAPDAGATWRVVAASGPVEALPPNAPADSEAWSAVHRGDRVPARAIVRTGKRGRTTLARTDAVVVVAPNSRLELPSEAPRPGSVSSVVQTEGSVYYEIERREQPHFEVVTPYLVAGVKGTTFLVSVDVDGATVGVDDGLVEVSDASDTSSFDVGAGEFVSIGRDGERLERLDADDRDDRRERRRESRTMARLKSDREATDDVVDDDRSQADDRSDDDVDAIADADSFDDDSDDDLIAGGRDDESDDLSRDDESLDGDVYTDDGASDSSRVDPVDPDDGLEPGDSESFDTGPGDDEDPERPGRGKPYSDDRRDD